MSSANLVKCEEGLLQLVLQQAVHPRQVSCCQASPPRVLVYEDEQGSLLQEPPQSSVVILEEGRGGQEKNAGFIRHSLKTGLNGWGGGWGVGYGLSYNKDKIQNIKTFKIPY